MTFHQQEISFWIENIILIFRTLPEPDSEEDSLKQNPGSCAVRKFEESKHLQAPSKQNDVHGSNKETHFQFHEALVSHEINWRDLHIENLNQSLLRDKSETQKDNSELMVPNKNSYLKSPEGNHCLVSHQQRILQDTPEQNNFLDPPQQNRLEGSSKKNHNQNLPNENHSDDSPPQENHVQESPGKNHFKRSQHSPAMNHNHGSPTENHRSSPGHMDKSVQCDFMTKDTGRDGGCQSKDKRLETEDKLQDIIASLAFRKMHQINYH
jgi:hypothetical protein